MAKSTLIAPINLGLYLGQPSFTIPSRGLDDCLNVRVRRSKISSFNMGWEAFTRQPLNGPVTLIDNFFRTDGSEQLIVGTLTDLYVWDAATSKWLFITQRYDTGTASASGTGVTGVGTLWNTAASQVRAGDEIHFGAAGQNDPNALWYRIASVTNDTTLVLDVNVGTIGSGNYTIRRKFQSASMDNYWRSETFPRGSVSSVIADRWYATNGIDSIVRFAQGDTQVTRIHEGASGFKAKELRRFKNMLLYLNVVENSGTTPNKPLSFKNSDVGLPETMTGGLAGEFVAAPGTAAIVTSLGIADDLAIYTENEVVLSTFVGAPEVFAFRAVVRGTGLIAGRLAAQFSETHQFFGRDALYTFNGVQAEATDNHVWVHVLRSQDQNRIRFSHSIFDEENGQLVWAAALTGDVHPLTINLNELLYSEQLDSASWVKSNATVTANNAVDPVTGLTTAGKLVEDATAAVQHGIHQTVAKTATAITYTFSAYCDPDTRSRVRLRVGDTADTDTAFADFNLATDAVTSGVSGTGYAVVATSITSVGAYKRVAVTISTPASDTSIRCAVRLLDNTGAVSYNGDGASGMWVWGAQLTQSLAATTYSRTSILAAATPAEIAPRFAFEAAYLEDLPPGTPTPHTTRDFPFTTTGFFTRASELTWNQMTKAWSTYNFAWSDRFLSAAFPLILAGDVQGRVWQIGTVDTQDGVGFPSFAAAPRRPISDMRTRNLLTRTYIMARRLPVAAYDLTVTTSLYDHQDSAATADVMSVFDLALAGRPWVPVYRVGRYAQVQVGTAGSATGQPWEWHGYDLDVRGGGGA